MAREDFKKKRDKDVVDDGIKTKLVETRRVCKVVKGGRNSSFAALVVAGDGKGKVGIGMGKATEVPEAIKKAEQAARYLAQRHVYTARGNGQVLLQQSAAETRARRPRRYRGRQCPRGAGALRHQQHHHQVLRLAQPDQRRQGDDERAVDAENGG